MKAESSLNLLPSSEPGLFYVYGGGPPVQGSGDASNFLLTLLSALMQQNGGLTNETKGDNLTQAFSFPDNSNLGGDPPVIDFPMFIREGLSEEALLAWQAGLYHTLAVNDPLPMTSGIKLADPGSILLQQEGKGVISGLTAAGGMDMEITLPEPEANAVDVVNRNPKSGRMSLLNSDYINPDKPVRTELTSALKAFSTEQNSVQLLRLNQVDGEVIRVTGGLEMTKPATEVQGIVFEEIPENSLENPNHWKSAGIQDGLPGSKQVLEAGYTVFKEQSATDTDIRSVEQAGSESHARGEIIKVDAGITNLGNVTAKKFPAVIMPQIISSVKYMTPDNGRVTVINLKLIPENMGEINIRLSYVKGELTAHFFTASGLVKDAVEYSLPQLREALAQQNIELGEAAAFVGQEQQNRGGAHSGKFESSKNRQRGVNGIDYSGNQPGGLPVLAGKMANVKSLNMLI